MNAKRLQIRMLAGDLARAAAFYRDGLEMHLVMQSPARCELTCAGARLVLTPGADAAGPRRETGFAVEVHGLEPALDRALAVGATLVARDEDGAYAHRALICDTEGNLIYLVEPLRRWA
jgi:predicted enzyme related to lactoylglutathione lyase